jgi:hypothetical protein
MISHRQLHQGRACSNLLYVINSTLGVPHTAIWRPAFGVPVVGGVGLSESNLG